MDNEQRLLRRRKAVVANEPQLARARCLASVFALKGFEPSTLLVGFLSIRYQTPENKRLLLQSVRLVHETARLRLSGSGADVNALRSCSSTSFFASSLSFSIGWCRLTRRLSACEQLSGRNFVPVTPSGSKGRQPSSLARSRRAVKLTPPFASGFTAPASPSIDAPVP